jgi:TonB family protein
VDAAVSVDSGGSQKAPPTTVPPKEMQTYLLTKVPPTYPIEAKKARIQGKVVLEAVIGKTGAVENLKAVSGPNELQQSALDAVRQWTYRPFLWNGEPIEVKTTITVIYTLKK